MMFSLTANDEPAAERHEHAAAATTAGNITLRTNVWEAYVDKTYWILPAQDMFFLIYGDFTMLQGSESCTGIKWLNQSLLIVKGILKTVVCSIRS